LLFGEIRAGFSEATVLVDGSKLFYNIVVEPAKISDRIWEIAFSRLNKPV
jgi:hypothetical protein